MLHKKVVMCLKSCSCAHFAFHLHLPNNACLARQLDFPICYKIEPSRSGQGKGSPSPTKHHIVGHVSSFSYPSSKMDLDLPSALAAPRQWASRLAARCVAWWKCLVQACMITNFVVTNLEQHYYLLKQHKCNEAQHFGEMPMATSFL